VPSSAAVAAAASSSSEGSASGQSHAAAGSSSAGATLQVGSLTVSQEQLLQSGIDPAFLAALPVDMMEEIIRSQIRSLNVPSQDASNSLIDPDFLAALPLEIQAEMLENERRQLAAAQPADASHAADMDNASFLATLTPEMRHEVLLTSDATFLRPCRLRLLRRLRCFVIMLRSSCTVESHAGMQPQSRISIVRSSEAWAQHTPPTEMRRKSSLQARSMHCSGSCMSRN